MPNYLAIVTCMGYSRRLSPRNSHLWLLNGTDVYSQHRAGMFATAPFFVLVQSTPSHREQSPRTAECVCVL